MAKGASNPNILGELESHNGELVTEVLQRELEKLVKELIMKDTTNKARVTIQLDLQNEHGVVKISPSVQVDRPSKIMKKHRVRLEKNTLRKANFQPDLDFKY